METANRQEMALILKQYKLPTGGVNYLSLMSIPSDERLPVMAKEDFKRTNMLIIGALTMAFESMNQKRGMNEFQILTLAEDIIDTSTEDNLSFQDLILFLQNLVRGKYKIAYESFDIPKFMELFEIYRQERHSELLRYRENEHLQFKGMGSAERSAKSEPLSEHFSKLGNTLHELKSQLRDERKENHVLKQAKEFYGE